MALWVSIPGLKEARKAKFRLLRACFPSCQCPSYLHLFACPACFGVPDLQHARVCLLRFRFNFFATDTLKCTPKSRPLFAKTIHSAAAPLPNPGQRLRPTGLTVHSSNSCNVSRNNCLPRYKVPLLVRLFAQCFTSSCRCHPRRSFRDS